MGLFTRGLASRGRSRALISSSMQMRRCQPQILPSCRVLCFLSLPASKRPAPPLSLPQLPLPKSSPPSAFPSGTHPCSVPRWLPPATLSIMHSHAHAGHGHHHHHHDNSYLTSRNKNDAGVRITRIGLYVNLGMAISKGVGGYVFNSQALIADGWHALTDLVSDFMTLATISIALKPATARYPNGYGKMESFGSLLVSGFLLTGGILMALQSGMALYTTFFTDVAGAAAEHAHHHGHDHHEHSHSIFSLGHSHSAEAMIPNLNAAWIALGSIGVKEWLYRATMKIAKDRKSSVLASNAVHHRIDSLTSIVALVAIGGAHLLNGAAWLDPVGGFLVSLMVIQAGWGNSRSAVAELCDASIDDEIKTSVKKAATKALQSTGRDDFTVKSVEGVKAGQNFLVDIEVAVPGQLSLIQLSEIESTLRERVGGKVRGVRRVRVKFVPSESGVSDFTSEFIPADVSPRSSPEPEHEHDHDHDHDHNHSHTDGNANGNSTSKANGKSKKRR